MTVPFVFITTHRVAPGNRAELDRRLAEYHRHLRANEPDLLAHYAYYDETGTELSLVQVQRDSDAAEHHMRVARELIGKGVELAAPIRLQVYGSPGPIVREALRRNGDLGAQVVVADHPDSGFALVGV